MSLEYTSINIEGKTRISPSSLASFYMNANEWYTNNITKTTKFTGNKNTVIGTIIHSRLENLFKGIENDILAENEYIRNQEFIKDSEVNEYIYELNRIWNGIENEVMLLDKPDSFEEQIVFEIPNSKYYIAGTYDYKRGNVLGDYKTASAKPSGNDISPSHRMQLLTYAYILSKQNIEIKYIEVVYIIKTKKPYVITRIEKVTKKDLEWIENELKNMVKRVTLVEEQPELEYILFPHNPLAWSNK